MAGLGVVLTAVYLAGLIVRPARRFARLGPDSILVAVLYAVGVIGLTQVS
jgi:cation:H+ antiporter